MTDPIADMLTRIRNAVQARHAKVDMPTSRLKVEIARILKDEGFISHYKTGEEEGQHSLTLFLKYGPRAKRSSTTLLA
jgi:small subunit ribosomal protein S8